MYTLSDSFLIVNAIFLMGYNYKKTPGCRIPFGMLGSAQGCPRVLCEHSERAQYHISALFQLTD